jgi:hypothetical protein
MYAILDLDFVYTDDDAMTVVRVLFPDCTFNVIGDEPNGYETVRIAGALSDVTKVAQWYLQVDDASDPDGDVQDLMDNHATLIRY